jgi:hypothetical protein
VLLRTVNVPLAAIPPPVGLTFPAIVLLIIVVVPSTNIPPPPVGESIERVADVRWQVDFSAEVSGANALTGAARALMPTWS